MNGYTAWEQIFNYLLKKEKSKVRITSSSSFCWRCFYPQNCRWTRTAWWGAAATAPAGRGRIWRRAASAPATSADQPAVSRETDRKGCDSGWGAAWWQHGSHTGWQESWSTDIHLTGQEKKNQHFHICIRFKLKMQEYLIPECSAVMILKLKLITSTVKFILCDDKCVKCRPYLAIIY